MMRAAVQGVCLMGMSLAMAALMHAAVSKSGGCGLVFAALWFSYLSIYILGQSFLSFQWDILLLEAGFICIFLPPLLPAVSVPTVFGGGGVRSGCGSSSAEPSPLVFWLLRFLMFKLMFLSGVV